MAEHLKPDNLRAQVLIIEDEVALAEVMAEALRKPGHVCTICHGIERAIDELKHGTFDVIVTDLRMPESGGKLGVAPDGADSGMIVLRTARKLQPQAECIMVTAHGDVQTTRSAFKEGVRDFIEKPLDIAVFRKVVSDAAEEVLLRHEATRDGVGELVQHDGFEGIIAGSEPMRKILRTVKGVSASQLPILILGESGTGKELIAQAVHKNSSRAKGRFVALNCAAETETLLEDQLFGHIRGAFTGAEKDREGVFEYATNGTLFLDEIGDMPLKMQAKLLRVLETGRVVRVGSNDERQTDVRLVSATNKDLKAMIAKGEFREDLYFRIKGAEVVLPPLRDRREDVPRIVNHALARCVGKALAKDAPVPGITDAAMMRLSAYSWPGNVRQLLNVVQNMVVNAMGEAEDPRKTLIVDVRHIPEDIRSADGPDDHGVGLDDDLAGSAAGVGGTTGGSLAGTPLEQIEKRAIRETLRMYAGNRELTAKALGIGERTLYRKLREYGLK
ncbi:MAG: sigma-54 dependent transcriptional regulator [Phycisphaerales bacterium]|nr:sigma-54 dependent transcriptional regulator [Phycisphaerales bacterium]